MIKVLELSDLIIKSAFSMQPKESKKLKKLIFHDGYVTLEG